MNLPTIVTRSPRYFLPEDLKIKSWADVEPFFIQLDERSIATSKELNQWLSDLSELDAVLEEEQAWRYIKMCLNTRDKKAAASFNFFVEKIEPEIAPFQNRFDKRLVSFEFPELTEDKALSIVRSKAENAIRTFRKENIQLHAKLQAKAQEFGAIASEMIVEFEGRSFTLQQAAIMLKDVDRSKREKVFRLITDRRLKDQQLLNTLFNELISLRHTVATNAGFDNYRDYKFVEMCRFDYQAKDCFDFHQSIKEHVVPIINEIDSRRKATLGYDVYRPWDSQVDLHGKSGLNPFSDSVELIDKTEACFNEIDPFFGQCVRTMANMSHLDLQSREGKAPGGFNYPLYEVGVPFIYMNAAGSFRDLVTMVHEGGHAIHSFLSRGLRLTAFKDLTSEVAELASMSMELISMEHWQVFFPNEDDYKRARREQLEQVIETLPWVAQIDKFQHWIYENPQHSISDREDFWDSISNDFSSQIVDWKGLEIARRNLWQKQLHLFEVPFYYIEYGMAQLGAIAVWRNYKNNPKKAIDQYKQALALGYTAPIDQIYATAGIEFNFNGDYVKELMLFVRAELDQLS
ncbi:MAG: M3 family oligoendopeptidase [Vicingaceae bacterium]